MRIRRISIGSFGALRDREFEVDPGLTVFHGPNESGKTTVMEFVRSAMVPSRRKKEYPSRKKTDSGTLVYDDDGPKKVVLEGKDRSGDVPSLPAGADDPELFRAVFAMDARGLDDDDAVRGDLRNRFLTVPGGTGMPAARDDLDVTITRVMGKKSNSKSRVIAITDEIRSNAEDVAEARRGVDTYGELAAKRDDLVSKLEDLRRRSRDSAEDRRIHDLYRSQSGNYGRLAELRRQESSLGQFTAVSEGDRSEHDRLVSEAGERRAAQDALERQRDSLGEGLRGADRRTVMSHAREIDALPGRLESHRDRAPVRTTRSVRRTSPLVYIGAVIAVAGLAGMLVAGVASLAVTAVGAVVIAVGLLRPSHVTVEDTEAPADDGLERDVTRLMSSLGLASTGLESDVSALVSVREAAGAISRMEGELMRAQLDRKDAELALSRFESRFGGPEGFDRALVLTSRLSAIRSETESLRRAISSAGLDPDVPECPVDYVETGTEGIETVSRELGDLDRAMAVILDTKEVERLMDRREELDAELSEALTEGAVAILALSIADDACDDAYSTVQPGVVSTADRYLGMMTGGAYRLDSNPMSKELSVRSGDDVKPADQWSSGLRAQVLLSIKLAIAREMGCGEVPMILDDVLLPFDSERKEGACRALLEVSGEMQVLMFTCDRETAGICSEIGAATVRM